MRTRILNTDSGEVVELRLPVGGRNILSEVICKCDREYRFMPTDAPEGVHFQMGEYELAWWERFADDQRAVLGGAMSFGEVEVEVLCLLIDEYGTDMNLLRAKEEEHLGL